MTKPIQSKTTLVTTSAAVVITLIALIYFAFFGTSTAVKDYRNGLAILDPKKDKDKLGELRWAARQADQHFEWKTPIAFYGKIVDEQGNAVPKAVIDFSWNDLSAEGSSRKHVLSDSQGMFFLTGVRGKILEVNVQKDGYHTPRANNRRFFEYANCFEKYFHRPNAAQPVVFHLLKKNVAEPLVHKDLRVLLSHDGSPVNLDVLSGKTGGQGNMEFRMWRSSQRDGFRFNWRLVLRIPDGGLIDAGEEVLFMAPATGYTPELDINMSTAVQDWRQTVKKQLCFMFGSPPKYGRMDLKAYGNNNFVRIEFWVNPSGSRTLE